MNPLLNSRAIDQTLVKWFIDRFIYKQILKRNAEALQNREFPIAVYANDWIGTCIFLEGIYEKNEIDDVLCLLEKLGIKTEDLVAFDIGANIGNHSIRFANKFLAVHSFEPNPVAFNLLKLNSQNFSNIKIHNFGFGETETELFFMSDMENLGGARSLNKNLGLLNSKGMNTSKIQIKKVDDFIKNNPIPNFIKIDVEGMELEVIKGAAELIKRTKPIIVLEQNIEDVNLDTKESDAVTLLREYGYNICWIESRNPNLNPFMGKFENFFLTFTKKKVNRYIVTGEKIPFRTHSLLICLHND